MNKAVAFEDTACIGVDDENGVPAGVKKNGVGGFGPDAVNCE